MTPLFFKLGAGVNVDHLITALRFSGLEVRQSFHANLLEIAAKIPVSETVYIPKLQVE